MPMFSLEKLDAILQYYANEAPLILPHKPEENTRMKSSYSRIMSFHGTKFPRINTLGSEAMQFIDLAPERYHRGILSPPLSKTKVHRIYTLFDQLNIDLLGCENGTQEEQMYAQEWDQYWESVIRDHQHEGKQLTERIFFKEQSLVLTAYREKTLHLCLFKPKGWQTHEVDEIRAQQFLDEINQCYAQYSSMEAYQILHDKFHQELTHFLCLELQALSRHLNLDQQREYGKKFEQIMAHRSFEFLGNEARSLLFKEITKDEEFLKQLPYLLDNSASLKHFILEHRKTLKV